LEIVTEAKLLQFHSTGTLNLGTGIDICTCGIPWWITMYPVLIWESYMTTLKS